MNKVETTYMPPEPTILKGYNEHTCARRPESYYRCGYQVEGAKPVMVAEYARSSEDAERTAKFEAQAARDQLIKMGAPSEVFWWTQKWTTTTTDTYDSPKLEPVA